MRIGINCQSIYIPYEGGINTYIFGLLNGFIKIGSKNEFVIFLNKGQTQEFNKKFNLENSNIRVIELSNTRSLYKKIIMFLPYILNSRRLWKLFNDLFALMTGDKIKIENNCDILYTPSTVSNIYQLKIPTVVSMHDIQHVHYPHFFSQHDLRIRNLTFENTALYVDYIQASTNFIKNDLLSHFRNIKKNQIFVINEGVDGKKFNKDVETSILKKYSLPDKYFFYPAQLWKHKNHLTLLYAINFLKKKNKIVNLVLTGEEYAYNNEVTKYIEKERLNNVFYLGKVNFEELLALYINSHYVIAGALYESSSLTIYEAAVMGVPILASKIPCHVEQSRDYDVKFFEPEDYIKLAEIFEFLFYKESQIARKRIIENNQISVNQNTWENIAKLYIKKFREIYDTR